MNVCSRKNECTREPNSEMSIGDTSTQHDTQDSEHSSTPFDTIVSLAFMFSYATAAKALYFTACRILLVVASLTRFTSL